jgi:prepilin-type N-terminal cleavage/methylation domain-containing protein
MTELRLYRIRRRPTAGVTLVEVLVAVAVLGILLAVASPALSDLLERRRVIAAANEIAGVLAYARSESNVTDSQLIVWFAPDPDKTMSCVAVTTDKAPNTCECWKPADTMCTGGIAKVLRLYQLPSSANVSFTPAAEDWKGLSNRMRFSRLQFTVDVTKFRVDVVGLRGAALRVEVNPAGRVRTCSPDGSMSGYGSCST